MPDHIFDLALSAPRQYLRAKETRKLDFLEAGKFTGKSDRLCLLNGVLVSYYTTAVFHSVFLFTLLVSVENSSLTLSYDRTRDQRRRHIGGLHCIVKLKWTRQTGAVVSTRFTDKFDRFSVMPFVLALLSFKIGRSWTLNYIFFTSMYASNLLSDKYLSY